MSYFYTDVLAYAASIVVLRGQRNKKTPIASMAFFLMALTIGAMTQQMLTMIAVYNPHGSIHILILLLRQLILLVVYQLIYDDDWLVSLSVAGMAIMTVAFSKLIFEAIVFIPKYLPLKEVYIANDGFAYNSLLVFFVVIILKYYIKLRIDLIQREEQHYIISLIGMNLFIFKLLGSYFEQQFIYNVSHDQLIFVMGFTSLLALHSVKFIIERSGEVLLVSQYEDLERYLPALYESLIDSKRSALKVLETMITNPLAKENLAVQLREIDFYEVSLCKNPTVNAFILMNYLQLKKQNILFQTELLVNKEMSYRRIVHIFGILRRCIDYLTRIIIVDNDKRMLTLCLYEQYGQVGIEFIIETTTRREKMIEVSMNKNDGIISRDYQQLNEYIHIHNMAHRFIFEDNGIKLIVKERKMITVAGIKLYES